MARKTTTQAAGKKKQPSVAPETHQSIAEQTEAFLRSGNKIQEIPAGVSGQQGVGKRHIVLGNRREQ